MKNKNFVALVKQPLLLLLVLVFILGDSNLSGQSSNLEDVQVSLITCDPGDGIDMLFGHSAVRVKTSISDIVFNYGTFDFETPGFVVKFMRGKLPYILAKNHFSNFLRVYQSEKRTVREQILNLTPDEKYKYISFLENNALPENALYKYDFFFDNCSTRIRDGLEGLGEEIVYPTYTTTITYRNILHQYLQGALWTKHGIDLIIGSVADKEASVTQQMFIPDYLHDHFKNTKIGDRLLAPSSKDLFTFSKERANRKMGTWLNPTVVYLLLIGLWLMLWFFKKEKLAKNLTKLVYVIVGLAGVLITFLWFGTDHLATKLNWNILWLNPIVFIFLVGNRPKFKMLKYGFIGLTVICLMSMQFGVIPQHHPSWSLALFLVLVYLMDSYFEWKNAA